MNIEELWGEVFSEMDDPQYSKFEFKPAQDYRHMTWETFLTVREWAQEVANRIGYPVYLVGSVLYKLYPRDIDLAIIMPLADYEERFGKLSEYDTSMPMKAVNLKNPYQLNLEERLRGTTRVDLKITPDIWFKDRDKLILAVPNGNVLIRAYNMPNVETNTV